MPQSATYTLETILETALTCRPIPVTAAHTITIGAFFPCDATGGAFAITLPLAGALDELSRILIIKKTDASGNAVTVTRAGSDTIDGATTYALSAQYDTVVLIDDEGGGAWHVMGSV